MNRRTFITAILGTMIAAKILPPVVQTEPEIAAGTPLTAMFPNGVTWTVSPHCPPDRIFAFDPNDFMVAPGDVVARSTTGSDEVWSADCTVRKGFMKDGRFTSLKNISL